MKKIERDGKVAVLYSPGFGAGWSTWNSEWRESFCMNAEIVQPVLDGDLESAKQAVARLHPEAYVGGYKDLEVIWVPKGEQFEVTEYDGNESVNVIGEVQYMIA